MRVPPVLNVYRHDTDNRTLITLTGEIDLTSALLVHASLERCLYDGIRAIDVDVTAVTFCDSMGLNAFLYALVHVTAAGGSLQLRDPSPALERLVTLTGSGSLFLTLPDAHAGNWAPPQPFPLPQAAHWLALSLPALPGGVLWRPYSGRAVRRRAQVACRSSRARRPRVCAGSTAGRPRACGRTWRTCTRSPAPPRPVGSIAAGRTSCAVSPATPGDRGSPR